MPLDSNELPGWYANACAMDGIEAEYDVGMVIWKDRPDIVVMGHWYFCPQGAVAVPYLYPWLAAEWFYGQQFGPPLLGEVTSTIKFCVRPLNPRLIGQVPLGLQTDWEQGSLYTGRPYWQLDIDGLPVAINVPTIATGTYAGGAGIVGRNFDFGSFARGHGLFGHVGQGGTHAGGLGHIGPMGGGRTLALGAGLFGHVGGGGCFARGAGLFGHVGGGGCFAGGAGLFGHVGSGGTFAGGAGLGDELGSGGTFADGGGLFGHIGSGGTFGGGAGLGDDIGSGGTFVGGAGLFGHEGSGGTTAGGIGIFGGLTVGFGNGKYDFDRSEANSAQGAGVCVVFGGSNGGSGQVVDNIAGMFFAIKLTTGPGSSSGAATAQMNVNNSTALFSLQANASNEVDIRIEIPTLSTSAQRFKVQVGFMDVITGTPSEGCWLEYTDNVNAGKWVLNTKKTSGGAGNSSSNSTVAPAAATITLLSVKVTGSSAEFFADGVSLGTIATNVPTAATGIGITIIKSVGTNSVELDVDYIAPTTNF